ncbi:MAG TPA: hypothetical protein VGI10_17755 [Polyangiaceae bacterium]
MKRRQWLSGCVAGAASLALGWPRRADACGSGIQYDEEEVLDLASGTSEPVRELAHFLGRGHERQRLPPLRDFA